MPVMSRTAHGVRLGAVVALVVLLPSARLVAQDSSASPPATPAAAADSARIARIVQLQKDAEERNKTFKFGVSIGWRHRIADAKSFYRDAVLDPADSTVQVDTIDSGDAVISAVMIAFPWHPPAATCRRRCGNLWRLGFVANVDLASFANEEGTTFNKSIEGGGGLGWRLGDDFSLALTMERIFSRRLRSYVKPGEKLPAPKDGSTQAFSRANDTYFRDDNLTALSFKFVYFFK